MVRLVFRSRRQARLADDCGRASQRTTRAPGSTFLRQGLLLTAAGVFATALTLAGLALLRLLYAGSWVAAHWYHPVFGALCVVPAAAIHCLGALNGLRGTGLWLIWVPGIVVYAAFPWKEGDAWRPLWIFGHALDWGRTIVLYHDAAGTFVVNSGVTFVAMLAVAGVVCGRLWFGAAKAFGQPASLAGKAYVTDGDGIRVRGHEVRFAGLDAPEWDQKAKHRHGYWFAHGRRVKSALIERIGGRHVHVVVEDHDRFGRAVGVVTCDGRDVGEWLVREGHAIAAYDGRYKHAEREARRTKTGMWSNAVNIDPRAWRHSKPSWKWRLR